MRGRRLFLALILSVLSAAAVAAAGVTAVSQQGRAFNVSSLQISRGDTVHFSNDDRFAHQIYVESPSFTYESDEQRPGSSVDIPFTTAGTFEVRCHIHPKMLLRVEVK